MSRKSQKNEWPFWASLPPSLLVFQFPVLRPSAKAIYNPQPPGISLLVLASEFLLTPFRLGSKFLGRGLAFVSRLL